MGEVGNQKVVKKVLQSEQEVEVHVHSYKMKMVTTVW